jgi:hypothetical protein
MSLPAQLPFDLDEDEPREPYTGRMLFVTSVSQIKPSLADVRVDPEDQHLLREHTWRLVKKGSTWYVKTGVQPSFYLHQLICPGARIVDHANGNGLDNARANLRPATHQQNAANSRVKGRFKGVFPGRRGKRFRAQIRVSGKSIHLGTFDTEEQAFEAYKAAAQRHFGEFACLE